MTSSPELDNLVEIGKLKRELPSQREMEGLLHSGRTRLKDANLPGLSLESRFDLIYNAAHALALAALRWHGFRSDNRYLVFQVLPITLGLPNVVWRVLAKGHERRNRAEYEGILEMDDQLIGDLLAATEAVNKAVEGLGPVPPKTTARDHEPQRSGLPKKK